ncbi:MAG TPA: hypothetical protein VEZ89_15135 [Rubrivivax sp.]|nr:hypothetical protein [Rubrivivax sp.]
MNRNLHRIIFNRKRAPYMTVASRAGEQAGAGPASLCLRGCERIGRLGGRAAARTATAAVIRQRV